MPADVEYASLPRAGAGRIITRGLRSIGRQLIEEREADARSGRRFRTLSLVEYQAILAVRAEELHLQA
jgi:hypothetical protein